jgi:hypothetical protein
MLEDGLLWFLYTPRTRKLDRAYTFVKRLCVPRNFRAQIAIDLHDNNLHLGFQRQYATAKNEVLFSEHVRILERACVYMSNLSRSEGTRTSRTGTTFTVTKS